MDSKQRSGDKAAQEMLECMFEAGIENAWDRLQEQEPQCGFGKLGICCRNCSMGPCRIDPFEEGPQRGICGATADTIAARNLVRMIAAGAAAHSDHGRDIAHTFKIAAGADNGDYMIKDEAKLKEVAARYGIETKDRDIKQIAGELSEVILSEFGKQAGTLTSAASYAPAARQKVWNQMGITPRSIDREIVEIMHRTHIGVGSDYKNLVKQGLRACLSDGWGGSLIATELSDILFGSPVPIRFGANLGVLEPGQVNIVVHGHEPSLSDIIVGVSQKPELLKTAKEKGAEGINIAGICCTANEILMRHGIPVAGNFLQQELAIMTGAVDVMLVDVQCIMPALGSLCNCFHTKLITTSPKCKIEGAEHIEFSEERAVQVAGEIIKVAVENFTRRKGAVNIPKARESGIAGFTTENTFYALGGRFRGSYRPLNDAVISGRLRGAAGVIGCNNPKQVHDSCHIAMIKELIKNDVLVVSTGCGALAAGKAGLMRPDAAAKYCGDGLAEICETVGIPPVLHVGSCVDNSRILTILANMVSEGGLGEDISDLPVAGAAPEWMSEKAVSIGMYFVASGVYTVIAEPLPIQGAKNLTKYLTSEIERDVGGKWAFERDPIKAAGMMIEHIERKRDALGINKKAERKLYDMEDRRALTF
ncbi:MAG TPA: anaerobic carbon-monoxide dehydrogenase catalytic subunit [Planctomycetes bacterium]|nr:anaerobic carbon-monoxide dehydrogenase catalytic subunit [Planctomycetota bacterium]HIJ69818.1 anaerobic carbon-monoxide dehydrogenase catalytic subunit [Planctomycetota bacterium]